MQSVEEKRTTFIFQWSESEKSTERKEIKKESDMNPLKNMLPPMENKFVADWQVYEKFPNDIKK